MGLVTLGSAIQPDKAFIRLNSRDNVVVARVALSADSVIAVEDREIRIHQAVGAGHKIAVADIPQGAAVLKYGENIGTAREPIRCGELVHVHNLLYDVRDRQYEFSTSLNDLSEVPLPRERTSIGYRRADGRVGTRNYVAIVGASNCAAHATQKIEAAFRHESFEGTGIDGVVCFPHADGCGQAEGPDTQLLRRTLDGLADHPNVAAAVVVGLGCEVNQISYYLRPDENGSERAPRRGFTLQDSGGTRRVVADSVKAVWELIAEVGRPERVECAASKLVGPGQGVCEVRGRRYRRDAPPLIDGPNEEVNPVEAMIAPLAACAVLFLQHLARTMDVPIEDVTAEAEADFDPRGVRGEDVDSALAAVRLTYRVRPGSGADRAGVEKLVEAFRARCPVHRTFAKAVDIAEEIVLV